VRGRIGLNLSLAVLSCILVFWYIQDFSKNTTMRGAHEDASACIGQLEEHVVRIATGNIEGNAKYCVYGYRLEELGAEIKKTTSNLDLARSWDRQLCAVYDVCSDFREQFQIEIRGGRKFLVDSGVYIFSSKVNPKFFYCLIPNDAIGVNDESVEKLAKKVLMSRLKKCESGVQKAYQLVSVVI